MSVSCVNPSAFCYFSESFLVLPTMPSISSYKIILLLCFPILLSGFLSQNPIIVTANELSTHDVKILFMMNHDYGANYHYIRPILEQYGWNVTITSLFGTLEPCTYQSVTATLDVDVLIPNISNITDYDAISIMPRNSHDNLRASQAALDLIREAVDEGLIVSAWCRGVGVLAAANVLNGVNITGHADYREEYEAAGAIFNELVPPVIDGNIVTGVRSRFYRTEMCIAIATALGVYEADAAEVSNTNVTPELALLNDIITITARVTDASGILSVDARVFKMDNSDKPSSPTRTLEMNDTDDDGTYATVGETFDLGNYSVDIRVYDLFENRIIVEDAVSFRVVEEIPAISTTSDSQILYYAAAIIPIACVIILIAWKFKKG
jgi:putative intracellular protease/amidase